MFWAGFGYNICTELVPLDGDPDLHRGGVTAQVIYDLYQDQLPGFIQAGDIFMQDNAPVHTAQIIYGLLKELGINTMIWPPYSPDLNPIENLWDYYEGKDL
jgi:transposase